MLKLLVTNRWSDSCWLQKTSVLLVTIASDCLSVIEDEVKSFAPFVLIILLTRDLPDNAGTRSGSAKDFLADNRFYTKSHTHVMKPF